MYRRGLMAAALASGIPRLASAAAHPVVLELFTSQGCSSCPPADALLGRLAQRPDVVALAWHVDYWDHLGWRDRFANRAATTRQRSYARELGGGVFTPALVVDGTRVVVGSRRSEVETALTAAQALPVPVMLSRSESGVLVQIGAAPGPAPNALSMTPNRPPTSAPARTTATGCASTASCARSRRWANGTAPRDSSPCRRRQAGRAR